MIVTITDAVFTQFVWPAVGAHSRSVGEAALAVQVYDKLEPLSQQATGERGEDTRRHLITDPTDVDLTEAEVEFMFNRLQRMMQSTPTSGVRPLIPLLTQLKGGMAQLLQERDSQIVAMDRSIRDKIDERNQLDAQIAEREQRLESLPDAPSRP